MRERNNRYSILFSRQASKALARLPGQIRLRLLESIETLREDPFVGKPLSGPLQGSYSVRVWPFRVLYEIRKKELTITVVSVGHRKDIYRV
jgi:mRNA interferase RelE/StbE